MFRKYLFTNICWLFCSIPSFAQDVTESIQQIQDRTLIIVLESPLKSVIAKLNPEEISSYEKAIENYNRKLKEVTHKFWTLNTNSEFKTWDEVNALLKDKSDKYVLLYAANHSTNPSINESMMQKGLKFSPAIFSASAKRNYDDSHYYTSFEFCLLGNFKKNKPLVKRTITNLWPLKEDIIFAWQYIQCLLLETKRTNMVMDIEKVVGLHKDEMKRSLLLLERSLIEEDLSENAISSVYPHTYKVVDNDTLLKKITERENVCYVEVTPQLVSTGEAYRMGYEHIVMNAQSGMIMAYKPVNSGILHANMGHGHWDKFISIRSLRVYAKGLNSEPSGFVEPGE